MICAHAATHLHRTLTHVRTNTPHHTPIPSDTRTFTETDATTKNFFVFLVVFTPVSQAVFSCVVFFQSVLVPLWLGATSFFSRDCCLMTEEETIVFECAAACPSWLDRRVQTCSCRCCQHRLSLSTHMGTLLSVNDSCGRCLSIYKRSTNAPAPTRRASLRSCPCVNKMLHIMF